MRPPACSSLTLALSSGAKRRLLERVVRRTVRLHRISSLCCGAPDQIVARELGVQDFAGRTQQHIVTASYELSPTRSFGGRIVVENADTNWYLSYRSSGARGTEMYFLIGDPNAQRSADKAAIKFVFAL